ncbi:MAG: TerB family tellurite resistance protein [Bacteroidetes bacterium]|nr:TerB family tellurite resistance protein [Bacteroidota bacterium]
MNKVLSRKINLLLHLANIDGKFHASEKELLLSILKEKGLDESFLEEHNQQTPDLETLHELPDKTELFYWILKMIMADGEIHADETKEAKNLAVKLGFSADAVDHFCHAPMPELSKFRIEMVNLTVQ